MAGETLKISRPRELVAYLNGRLVPLSQAMAEVSETETGSPGGLYDAERTFNGQIFKTREHLQRLYRSLEFARIDPGMSIDEMESLTLEVLEANSSILEAGDDFTVAQVVSVGPMVTLDGPTPVDVLIYCQFIDFAKFAQGYLRGVRVVTPVTYRAPPGPENPAVPAQETFSLMTDHVGNITECRQANFFFVKDGRIKLPSRKRVLPGISMETMLELAKSMNVDVDESDYSSANVYDADEAFVTGTRYCMLPVATFNGLSIGDGVPGPIVRLLLKAWSDRVGVDVQRQALDHGPGAEADAGLVSI
jgi:branched-chain amino acid aminotransferase